MIFWYILSQDYLKGEIYNSILVTINWLTKIVYYKLIKIIINASGLAKVITDMVIR